MIEILKEYGTVINITLLIALIAIAIRTNKIFVKRKAIQKKELECIAKQEEETKYTLDNSTHFKVLMENVAGRYRVLGKNSSNPIELIKYHGILDIEIQGDILYAEWKFDSSEKIQRGIGLVMGNQMSFSFWSEKSGSKDQGIVIYEFISEKLIAGKWTQVGAKNTGYEECEKL